MNDYEKTFVTRMNQLRREGYDFRGGSRAALEAKFGGAADVLLRDLSVSALLDPAHFATELSKTFGRGSIGFLQPIVKFADMGLFPRSSSVSPVGVINDGLPPSKGGPAGQGVPLHDQRIRDDESKYADEYD